MDASIWLLNCFSCMADSPLNDLFGFITRIFFEFFGNYGLAIVALTILVRGVLIPLNVHSQKSMIKQQALASKQAEIKRKYPDDKQKQQEEMSKLLSDSGVRSFGGCIMPFLQIFFILPIFYVVRMPLKYITQVSEQNIERIGQFLFERSLITENDVNMLNMNNIPIIRAFQENPDLIEEVVQANMIKVSQLIDMHFWGVDLSRTPAWQPAVLFGPESSIYGPLLLIPVIVLITMVIQMRLTTILKPDHKKNIEAKERAKSNPARSSQVPENPAENTMKMMNVMMPVFMLITTFVLPSAMGFYWIVGNIMGIIQQVVSYYLFTRPFEEKKAEMEIKKAMAFSKKKVSTDDGDAMTPHKRKYSNKKKKR